MNLLALLSMTNDSGDCKFNKYIACATSTGQQTTEEVLDWMSRQSIPVPLVEFIRIDSPAPSTASIDELIETLQQSCDGDLVYTMSTGGPKPISTAVAISFGSANRLRFREGFLIENAESHEIFSELTCPELSEFLSLYDIELDDRSDVYYVIFGDIEAGPFSDYEYNEGVLHLTVDARHLERTFEDNPDARVSGDVAATRELNAQLQILDKQLGRHAVHYRVLIPERLRGRIVKRAGVTIDSYAPISLHVIVDPLSPFIGLFAIHAIVKLKQKISIVNVYIDHNRAGPEAVDRIKIIVSDSVSEVNKGYREVRVIYHDLYSKGTLEPSKDALIELKSGTADLLAGLHEYIDNGETRIQRSQIMPLDWEVDFSDEGPVSLAKQRIGLNDVFKVAGFEVRKGSAIPWPIRTATKITRKYLNSNEGKAEFQARRDHLLDNYIRVESHSRGIYRIPSMDHLQSSRIINSDSILLSDGHLIPLGTIIWPRDDGTDAIWVSGGLWLESVTALMISRFWGPDECMFEPEIGDEKTAYTPEGYARFRGLVFVWDCKDMGLDEIGFQSAIGQISEYAQSFPLRDVIPLLIYSHEVSDSILFEARETANAAGVIISPWWEIADVRSIARQWNKLRDDVDLSSVIEQLPQHSWESNLSYVHTISEEDELSIAAEVESYGSENRKKKKGRKRKTG